MHLHFSSLTALGRMLLLAGAATVALTNVGYSQACCNNGGGIIDYGGMPMMEAYDPAAELEEPIDPAKTLTLTVIVPEKAKVIVNGEPTFTKGISRQYIVRDVVPGKTYTFVVEAVYVNPEGAEYSAKKDVKIAAGGSERVVMQLRRTKRAEPKPLPVAVIPPVVAPVAPR